MACVLGKDDASLATLLTASLAGDEKAYAAFLRQVAGLVRAYARRRIAKGGVDAEDVVQETLLAIHLKRHTWRQGSAVEPWVYAIARHKLIDAFRKQGRYVELDIDDFENDVAAPQDDDRLSERDLGRALDTLAPGQRSVVSSVSVDGRSISETAAALNMNETAVRVALHRGLKALAKRFGQG